MDNGESSYRRFLDGDKQAFDGIMKAYFDHLVFFIDRYVRDTAEAEDIAIDVFAELAAHPNKYDGRASLKTYLFMMGRSRALNQIKRRASRETAELKDGYDADRESLEERFLSNERERAVAGAIASLPQKQREAVHLVYYDGMSYEEAAKVMKRTKKQIDNLLYRAKGALRAILGKEWSE